MLAALALGKTPRGSLSRRFSLSPALSNTGPPVVSVSIATQTTKTL
jgi:hypothetical protein